MSGTKCFFKKITSEPKHTTTAFKVPLAKHMQVLVFVFTSVCVHVFLYVWVCAFAWVCACMLCIFACAHSCLVFACTCVFMCVHVYGCGNICVFLTGTLTWYDVMKWAAHIYNRQRCSRFILLYWARLPLLYLFSMGLDLLRYLVLFFCDFYQLVYHNLKNRSNIYQFSIPRSSDGLNTVDLLTMNWSKKINGNTFSHSNV